MEFRGCEDSRLAERSRGSLQCYPTYQPLSLRALYAGKCRSYMLGYVAPLWQLRHSFIFRNSQAYSGLTGLEGMERHEALRMLQTCSGVRTSLVLKAQRLSHDINFSAPDNKSFSGSSRQCENAIFSFGKCQSMKPASAKNGGEGQHH